MTPRAKETLTMVLFGYLGLGFPDIDLLFLKVLNHRSIVTHSILLPALFLAFRHSAARHGACGFILGVSIHLSADVLSPPVGFGAIWLPWPIKVSLGPLSPVWLGANAVVGLIWAKVLLLRLPRPKPLRAYFWLSAILAPSYALAHERSLLPLISFAVMFGVSFLATKWVTGAAWFRSLAGPTDQDHNQRQIP